LTGNTSNSTFRIASPTAPSAGVLLIAKDRFVQFPDAYIKAARFEGSTGSRVLDMQEIRTPLPGGTALQWAPALIQSSSSQARPFAVGMSPSSGFERQLSERAQAAAPRPRVFRVRAP
jgi:hypothetical protein